MGYAASGMTHSGKTRSFNEDAYLVFVHQDVLFMLVSDGIGSRPGKEIASVVTLREIRSFLERYLPQNPQMGTVQYLLEQAIYAANRVVRSYALAHEEHYAGWGATLTCVAVNQQYDVVSAHIGNTRWYSLRSGEMTLMTKDHTETQMEIDLGRLQESERWSHPGRAVLTRGIGMNDRITVDVYQGQLMRGDLIFLSTDGVHGVLTSQGIQRLIFEAGDTQSAVQQIIEAVNELGGPDNLAAVLTYCQYNS